MSTGSEKNHRQALIALAACLIILSNSYIILQVHRCSFSFIQSSDWPSSTNRRHEIGKFPDWHLAIDCSVWDGMCPSTQIMENRYDSYPFPLSRHIKNLSSFNHHSISSIPDEWLPALNVDNTLDKPPPRPIVYSEYPLKVSMSEREKCMKEAYALDWRVQIDNLLQGKIKKEKSTDMIAYTISDYNYAFDMVHDIFAMNSDIVGFGGSFFMVALDKETLEIACTFGYPVISWHARPDDSPTLKQDVAFTKFKVSLYLIQNNISFFFYEMDVWFFKSPINLIAAYHNEKGAKNDILASSHVKDPLGVNIGVFSVTANERTEEYFELCDLMGKLSPNTHDQWIMGQLLLVAWIMKKNGKANYKFDREWKPPPPPEHNPPNMTKPVDWGLYNPMEIMSSAHPYPTKNTIAIHTLTKSPLKKPFGKKMLAKELGAWNGAGGYYSAKGESRRYLMMEGHDSPNSYNTRQTFEYHVMDSESLLVDNVNALRWTMATLLSLARRTGRIFIMPKVIAADGSYFLWSMLDFETVEKIHIEFRETNFPHNKKCWYSATTPFRSVARTALAPLTSVDQEGTMYIQLPSKSIQAWKFDNETSEAQALDSWWALHTAISEVDSAELILINPHFMSSKYARVLHSKMNDKNSTLSVAEQEIIAVFRELRWCLEKSIVNRDNIIGRSSAESGCQTT